MKVGKTREINSNTGVYPHRHNLTIILVALVLILVAVIASVSGYLLGSRDMSDTNETVETLVSEPLERITVGGSMSSDLFAKTLTMVYIPGTEMMMGAEDGDIDEKPLHVVFVDGFYIDQYEVTNECIIDRKRRT